MSGSSLTSYNSELVKALEDLREQREEMNRSILRDEEEKARIQKVWHPAAFATSEFTWGAFSPRQTIPDPVFGFDRAGADHLDRPPGSPER